MIYCKDFILLAAADTPENREEAKRYIARHKLTEDVVKLVKRGADIFVIVKTEAEILGS